MAYGLARRLEQVVGLLLLLLGLCFLLLLAFLKTNGELANEVKVSALLFGIGATLIWIGYRFLRFAAVEEVNVGQQTNIVLVNTASLRIAAEVLGTLGSLVTLLHGLLAFMVISWPTGLALYLLVGCPVILGQLILRIVRHGTLQSGVLPQAVPDGWTIGARRSFNLLFRVGWFGYVAIPFAWPDVAGRLPRELAPTIQLVACVLISCLYATQVLVVHLFGHTVQRDA